MTVKGILLASVVSAMCFVSCNNSGKTNAEPTTTDTLTKSIVMKSYISMFEIPAFKVTVLPSQIDSSSSETLGNS